MFFFIGITNEQITSRVSPQVTKHMGRQLFERRVYILQLFASRLFETILSTEAPLTYIHSNLTLSGGTILFMTIRHTSKYNIVESEPFHQKYVHDFWLLSISIPSGIVQQMLRYSLPYKPPTCNPLFKLSKQQLFESEIYCRKLMT